MKKVRELELVYAKAQLQLEVSKAQQLADVEAKKFKDMMEALGPGTIRDLAVAGPEMQVRTEECGRKVDVCLGIKKIEGKHTWRDIGGWKGLRVNGPHALEHQALS